MAAWIAVRAPRAAALCALPLLLSACSGGPAYGPKGCDPSGAASSVVSGTVAAGVSDEGFVTDRDIDLTIVVGPGREACR